MEIIYTNILLRCHRTLIFQDIFHRDLGDQEEELGNASYSSSMYGRNTLHLAAIAGQLGVLTYFTEERGLNPSIQDQHGWTPLHYAARYNHLMLAQYLVTKQQVDPLCQTKGGSTPLHKACQGGHYDLVQYLAKEMIKYLPIKEVLCIQDQAGWTPLHYAAMFNHFKIVQYLYSFKATGNIDVQNEKWLNTTA